MNDNADKILDLIGLDIAKTVGIIHREENVPIRDILVTVQIDDFSTIINDSHKYKIVVSKRLFLSVQTKRIVLLWRCRVKL